MSSKITRNTPVEPLCVANLVAYITVERVGSSRSNGEGEIELVRVVELLMGRKSQRHRGAVHVEVKVARAAMVGKPAAVLPTRITCKDPTWVCWGWEKSKDMALIKRVRDLLRHLRA